MEAQTAFLDVDSAQDTIVLPPHVLVEFASMLRGFVVRGGMPPREGKALLDALLDTTFLVYSHDDSYRRGFELATVLGQSDAFDATGYAIAERLNAEFWVSDRRFANAAASRTLPGVRFVP